MVRARPRLRPLALVTAIAILLVGLPSAGLAATTEEKLERAKEAAAELDRRIERAEAELAGIEAELDDLEVELEVASEALAEAEAEHRDAERAAAEAADRSAAADAELAAAEAELAANDELLRDVARDAYKNGMASASPEVALIEIVASSDAEALSDRLHYLHRSMGERAAAIEDAEVLVIKVDVLAERAREHAAEQERLLGLAEEARERSAVAHAEVEALLAETSTRLARQDELIAELEADRELAGVRIDELEERLEQERIERERRERERRERERREREERERREREERQRREQQRAAAASSGGSSGGGSGGGSVSSSPAGGGLVTVGGITVAASLAPQLQQLLNDARADGIVLGGHGYRSPEVTARLRRVNGCPDVYDSPASACRVPTARPGTSEHEKGLAVDFTYNGATICFPRPGSQCSGNRAFDWLRVNAHRYGLKNLSSEAWHWSTTGR